MVVCGCGIVWLCVVVLGIVWLCVVVSGFVWLCVVVLGFSRKRAQFVFQETAVVTVIRYISC